MKLIKVISNTFLGGELSNEAYHSHEGISGTGLSVIYSQSVKAWLETVRKPSDALGFGIASHSAFLEPELFKKEFYRGFDESKYPNALRTQNDFKAFLSKHGLKLSGSKGEQIERIKEHCKHIEHNVQIMDVLRDEWDAKNKGKVEVSAKDYDQLMRMRNRLMNDDQVFNMLKGAHVEKSIIALVDFFEELATSGEVNKGQYRLVVKIRPDIFTRGAQLVDYKTTRDCFDRFERDIFKMNYDLKMALQHDVLSLVLADKIHGNIGVWLLAQDKLNPSEEQNPHEYLPWYLGEDTLHNGRMKYLMALKKWAHYKNTGEVVGRGNAPRVVQLNNYDRVYMD